MGLIRDALKSGMGQSQNSYGSQQQQWGSQQPVQYRPQGRDFESSNQRGDRYSSPSCDYGGQYQRDPYASSECYLAPPVPTRHPSRAPYGSYESAPTYSRDAPFYDQQQSAPYGTQPNLMPSRQYSQYPLQPPRLPTSMAPGPLQRPFALPQTGAGSSAPFMRGFSDDLSRAGVSQRAFIQFVDALNLTLVPNPEMQLAGTAAGLAGWFVPGLAAGIALTAVQIGTGIGGTVVTKGATKTCLTSANQNIFAPCGLELQLKTSQQLNDLLGIYNTPPSFSPDPSSRIQMYESYIAPLSVVLPPAQGGGRSDPLASLGASLSNRKQGKQERKAAEDAAKGKMKKSQKIETGLLWMVVVNSDQGGVALAGGDYAGGRRASTVYGSRDEFEQDAY